MPPDTSATERDTRMSLDPAIVEAVARALLTHPLGETDDPEMRESFQALAEHVVTAAAPLIEAAALEKAAKVADDHRSWLGEETTHGMRIAAAIRAMKEQP